MASMTIGQVITLFEGRAEQLFQTIDNLEKKLDALSKKTFETKLDVKVQEDLSNAMEKAFTKIEKQMERTADATESLVSKVGKSLNSVKNQMEDVGDSTLGRLSDKTGGFIESTMAKTAVATLAFSTLTSRAITGSGLKGIGAYITDIFNLFQTQGKSIVEYGKGALDNILDRSSRIGIISDRLDHMLMSSLSLLNIGKVLTGYLTQWAPETLKLMMSFSKTGLALSGISFLLFDVNLLLRRVFGSGMQALTPLERATRLLTFFDDALNRTFFTWNKLFSSIGIGLTALLLPISRGFLLVPLINGLIGGVTNLYGVFRDKVLSAMGSGRASFALIIRDARQLLLTVMSPLISLGNNMKMVQINAENASKQMKKLKDSGNELRSASQTRLPIGAQIQEIFLQLRTFMLVLIEQIGKVVQSLNTGFNLTKDQISAIDTQAKTATTEVSKLALKSGDDFNKAITKSGWTRFWENNLATVKKYIGYLASIGGIIKGAFTGLLGVVIAPFSLAKKAVGYVQDKLNERKTGVSKQTAKAFETAYVPQSKQAQVAPQVTQQVASVQKVVVAEQTLNKTMNDGTEILKKYSKEINTVLSAYHAAMVSGTTFNESFHAAAETVRKYIIKLQNAFKNNDMEAAAKHYVDVLYAISQASTIDEKELTKLGHAMENLRKEMKGMTLPTMFSPDQIKAYFANVDKVMQGYESKLATSYQRVVGHIVTGKIPAEQAKGLSDPIIKLLTPKTAAAVNAGKELMQGIAKGIEQGKDLPTKAMDTSLKPVQETLGNSPPKRGPLTKIISQGQKLMGYLSQGIISGKGLVTNAANTVTEAFAKFFPRSLPAVGPLVKIVSMGFKISSYLAQGILSGINTIRNAANSITSLLVTPIMDTLDRFAQILKLREITTAASQMKLLSDRTGLSVEYLSSLQFAAESVGGSVSDLTYIFKGLREKIAQAMDEGPTGQIRSDLRYLGIDFKEIANASNPMLTMFYKLSDAASTFTAGTDKSRKALELLGTMGDTPIVNLAMKGSRAIIELQKEAGKLGTVFTSEFAEGSRKFVELTGKLEVVKDSLRKDFLAEILPLLNDRISGILKFIEENRAKIFAFLTVASNLLVIIAEKLKDIFVYIIKDPKTSFNKVLEAMGVLWQLLKTTVVQGFSILKAEIEPLLGDLLEWSKNKALPKFLEVTDFVWEQLDKIWQVAKDFFYNIVVPGVKMLVGYVGDMAMEALRGVKDSIIGFLMQPVKAAQEKFVAKAFPGIKNRQDELNEVMQESGVQEKPKESEYQKQFNQSVSELEAKMKRSREIIAQDLALAKEFAEASAAVDKATEKTVSIDNLKAEFKKAIESLATIGDTTPIDGLITKIQEAIGQYDALINKFGQAQEEARKALAKQEDPNKPTEEETGNTPSWEKKITDWSKSLYDGTTGALSNAFGNALDIFMTKGKMTMTDFTGLMKGMFDDSFKSIADVMKQAFTKSLDSVFSMIGMDGELGQAAIAGIMAVASMLLSRLEDQVEVVNKGISETVEKTEQVRGVIAGERQVGIMEVVDRLVNVGQPVTLRLDSIIALLRSIDLKMGGNRPNLGTIAENI